MNKDGSVKFTQQLPKGVADLFSARLSIEATSNRRFETIESAVWVQANPNTNFRVL